LAGARVAKASGNGLRERYAERVEPLLAMIGTKTDAQPDFKNFDEATRRTNGSAPDADTIRRVRGDKNRSFLMD
jgi:hypothetical protein